MELNDYHAAGNIWQLIIVSIHGVSGSKLEIYGDIEIRNGFMNYGPLCSNTDSGPYDLLHTSFFSEYTFWSLKYQLNSHAKNDYSGWIRRTEIQSML